MTNILFFNSSSIFSWDTIQLKTLITQMMKSLGIKLNPYTVVSSGGHIGVPSPRPTMPSFLSLISPRYKLLPFSEIRSRMAGDILSLSGDLSLFKSRPPCLSTKYSRLVFYTLYIQQYIIGLTTRVCSNFFLNVWLVSAAKYVL